MYARWKTKTGEQTSQEVKGVIFLPEQKKVFVYLKTVDEPLVLGINDLLTIIERWN